jgi:hypothetical protein
MITEGIHRGRAIKESTEFGQSPEKGTDFVAVTFEIADGEFKGQRIGWNGYFTDNSTKRTIESLQACGCTFPDNDITNMSGIDTNEVMLDVEHQTNQDGSRKFARVAWVNSLNRGISPELKMDQAKKASFRERMMGQVALLKNKNAQPAPTGKVPF